jgi:3-deoxy-manno-octulosonate cytidylyltransferase (CMP-KDO synthetase)
MKVIAIIPARYKSSRFEGKPLADILGKPMIQRVYERAIKAKTLNGIIVATDDERIFEAVKGFGGDVVMTSADCTTGTDRVAEVAKNLDCEIVANVQGDEPVLQLEMIDEMITPMIDNPSIDVGTLMQLIESEADYLNRNVVKVAVDKDGFALYFSRSSIPGGRTGKWHEKLPAYRHVGLYAYRKEALLSFISLPPGRLEQAEGLEQLRFLENGYKIKVTQTKYSSIGVDTPEDLEKVVEVLRSSGDL